MRKRLLSILLVAIIVLSGCSALDDTGADQPTASATDTGTLVETQTATEGGTESDTETDAMAQFETSARFPSGGVAGERSAVRVTVENTGGAEGSYDAALTADGDRVASRTVTLAAGESTTVTLNHTFERTGDHDLSVGEERRTIPVYDSAFEFTDAQMEQVETARIQESGEFDLTILLNETTVDATVSSSATTWKNFTAETLYTNETSRTTVFGRTSEEYTEEWVTDGTLYTRAVDDEGIVNYTREPSDEFEDSEGLENETILEYISTDHTDEEYVLVVESESSAEATELWRSFSDEESEVLPAEGMEEVYLEIRYDRQTGRTTEKVFRLSGEGGEEIGAFDATFRQEYVAYNETVTVEVPDEVRDQATRTGTTVESGTQASLRDAEQA